MNHHENNSAGQYAKNYEIHLVNTSIWSSDYLHELNKLLNDKDYQIAGVPINRKTRLLVIDDFLAETIDKNIHATGDVEIFHRVGVEPTVEEVDGAIIELKRRNIEISCVIAIGGGSTLDFGKAISNLLTNSGKASDYQGWDLLKNRSIPKIGVPTLFGTGSETSRTCVMLNSEKKLKLGMNSKYSMFDLIIIDSSLSLTASLKQIFFTGMDGYFHALEILRGRDRFLITDNLAKSSLELSKDSLESILVDKDCKSAQEGLALSSFFGGIALANGTVGLIHPISAALSVVFGVNHGEANCLAATALTPYYPEDSPFIIGTINRFVKAAGYTSPLNVENIEMCMDDLIRASIIHRKPLENHLGPNWRTILTDEELEKIFTNVAKFNQEIGK